MLYVIGLPIGFILRPFVGAALAGRASRGAWSPEMFFLVRDALCVAAPLATCVTVDLLT